MHLDDPMFDLKSVKTQKNRIFFFFSMCITLSCVLFITKNNLRQILTRPAPGVIKMFLCHVSRKTDIV